MDKFFDALEKLNATQLQLALYVIKCVEQSLVGFDFIVVNEHTRRYFQQEVAKKLETSNMDKELLKKPNAVKIIQYVIDNLWNYYLSEAEHKTYPLFDEFHDVMHWQLKGKNWRNWGEEYEERIEELELFTRDNFLDIFSLPLHDAWDELYSLYADDQLIMYRGEIK